MTTELDIIPAVTLPAAKLTRTALVIDNEASDEQLAQIGHALASIDGARSWWIGDYGCALQKRKGDAYTEGRAEALGIEPGTFRQYKMVAEFFPVFSRLNTLSFQHHFEAMNGAGGDLAVAQNWLDRAKANEWSVSELRKAVRESKAEYQDDGMRPTGTGYSALLDAERWASAQLKEIDGYTPERAAAILTDIGRLCALIERLREIAEVTADISASADANDE